MTRAAMRATPSVLRRLWRKTNSSRYACRCFGFIAQRVRADQPALQQRDRPVAGLHGVGLALLGFGLHNRLVRALAEARLVVAGMPVGRDGGVVATSPSAKRLQVSASLFSAWARRTRPPFSAAARTSCLCGPPLPPTSASSISTKGPSGSLSERTIAERSLCSHVHAVS